jgi:two-component system, OmpR family, sensor histidine kinase VanS
LEKETFDIYALILEVLAKYELIFKEEQIQVNTNRVDDLMVNADRSRIEQILVNFLNNAIDHVDERKQIQIRVEPSNDKVRIAVANTGAPIPDESLSKLFISFYKVDKARSRAYGGTGLGLSIVRAIMERHLNSYGVENNPNGVEFWFQLDKAESN